MTNNPTLVFGHRNPDTDSVCSAISFSYLKNKLGENTSPRVLGHINKETAFALNYFNVKEPEYLNNVKVQLRNVFYHKGIMLSENASIKEVVEYLTDNHITATPIVDDKKHLVSLITLKEIAMLFVEKSREHLNTNYEHVKEALNGREILKFHDEFDGTLIAGSYKSQTFIETAPLKKNDILIVGNRNKVIKHGLESGIALLVLTNNFDLDDLSIRFNVSKYTLSREFSKYFGISPIEYLIRKRIKIAKELLVDTNYTISEVSLRIGIFNTTHFINLFKKHTGITPLPYRKQLNKELNVFDSL